jgi:hypothetical protein
MHYKRVRSKNPANGSLSSYTRTLYLAARKLKTATGIFSIYNNDQFVDHVVKE